MPKAAKPKPDSVLHVYEALDKAYPDPRTELTYDSPFQLLIAVILSAQCTDERVNKTTPALFSKYPTAKELAKAKQADVEKLIHSCGFYRAKSKAIISTSKDLVEKFDGEVPGDLDKLTTLAGVGRKTASVILNQAFDVPAIAVDTHVKRVSQRLGWAHAQTPEKIEFELRALLPPELWAKVNGMLILHGRRLCKARKPLCAECFLKADCEFFKQGGEKSVPKKAAKRSSGNVPRRRA
ncbi:MAG: endonuclease III [Bdellovibrionota bacterium]